MDYNRIKTEVDKIYPAVVEYRRRFHQYPELSEQETETCRFILDTLKEAGIECRQAAGNGVIATIYGNGTSPKTIGIRGDIDALPITEATGLPYASARPGIMHACGHDMHGACLLGTALLLHAMRQEIPGNVKLFFQPAEETVGGAAQMIAEGCMENPKVDAVIALHVEEKRPLGTVEFKYGAINASTTEFHVQVNGASCHGAHPDLGVDAIVIAANIITSFQTVISRNLDPAEALVITIGKIQGGTKENVVAGQVHMSGTLRSLKYENRDFAKKRMQALARSVAEAYGGDCEVTFSDGYPPLINDSAITEALASVAAEAFGPSSVLFRENASLGADDFAFFSDAVPGCFFDIGTLGEVKDGQVLHSAAYAPDEGCMEVGILLMVGGVMRFLERMR